MSLTSLLKTNKSAIKLFSTLPNIKGIVKSYKAKDVSQNELLVPRYPKANPGLVGTAYDFWCRAYIQKINKTEKEVEISRQVLAGVSSAIELEFLKEEEADILFENIEIIWKMRSDYINGLNVNEDKLIKGCLILAHCEATYRNSLKPEIGYLTIRKADYYDLKNLCKETEKISRIFKTNREIHLNPTFGEYSKKVGGADADYIIGNMLVDIKTSQYSNIKKEYINQLLGYYLLSQYDKKFPCEIKQIGIFYPRYNKLDYFEIEDIKKTFNLKEFSNYFKNIIEKNETLENHDFKQIRQKILS